MPGSVLHSNIDSWLYMYGVGGVVFAAGIFAGLRTGQLSLRAGAERRLLVSLCAGFVAFAALHGAFALWGK